MTRLRVVVALGSFAWDAVLRVHAELSGVRVSPKPRFGHLSETNLGSFVLVGSYHPSQQNTFTGKLTEKMLDDVFVRSRALFGRD